ncbi:putative bifunctional diguanylate cyclase/phosphodiesterase [Marinomonas balearica]|uniref:Diguanylate cyclase (GGDEF)-like protein n=1 Tax=Marinomonas balearica TaxID=491947 RepID=A0A4R6M895_9GAMM|nr:EAL domain-containing protein [Marinomonas balearica]TDO97564.1 diguanylate cyclase (GGDEF)-like protein [Marinomonas balearica]
MEKQHYTLLLVEGEHQPPSVVRRYLEQCQKTEFSVDVANGFHESIARLMSDRFDLVLLDMSVDGLIATDFLKHANIVGFEMPVIVLNDDRVTKDVSELEEALLHLGASDFIPQSELTRGLLERSIRHVVERKYIETQIAQLLKRDPLTGLGNRLIFEEHAELAIARARRNSYQIAVIFMDLDRFKQVNDSLGHHVGDLLLTLISQRLDRSIRKSDVVARIGGDEFVLLLDNIERPNNASLIAGKILHAVTRPAIIGEHSIEVSASMGVAMYPQHGTNCTELMQKADMALYECKQQLDQQFLLFNERMQEKLKHMLTLERELNHAIETEAFELYYQPKIDLKSETVIGVEALIRWPMPDGSIRMPGDFIPEAVRTGAIIPIGEWALEVACKQIAQWRDLGARIPIAVNISPRHLKLPEFTGKLLEKVKRYDIDPGLLELELTEEALVETGASNIFILQEIRQAGVRIAIDDFGTGYSSMRYLKVLPIDCVKIDKTFISGGEGVELSDPTITQAIIFLAKGLSLDVVAEGVETEAQKQTLKDIGCDKVQGFVFSPPIPSRLLNQILFPEIGYKAQETY